MKYKKVKYPAHCYWEVTPKCNHNCVHCYNYWRKDEEIKKELFSLASEVSFEKMADVILERQPVSICITGGEPFMVWNDIKPQIERFIEKHIFVSINTNAALITPEIACFLKEKNIPCFISLPCVNEEICDEIIGCKGGWKRTNAGIALLVSEKVNFTCNMVVSTKNLAYVFDTAKFVRDTYGCKSINISRVGKPINSSNEFDENLLSKSQIRELIEQKVRVVDELGMQVRASMPYAVCAFNTEDEFHKVGEQIGCSAGWDSYTITCDGGVKACARDTMIYGNILEEEFEEIWERMSEWRDESLVPDDCKNCYSFQNGICSTGCRMDQEAMKGSRSLMDESAKIGLCDPRWKKRQPNYQICDDDVYVVSSLNIVQDYDGFRVNAIGASKATLLTEHAVKFLQTHQEISVNLINSEMNTEAGKAILTRLLQFDIVKKIES